MLLNDIVRPALGVTENVTKLLAVMAVVLVCNEESSPSLKPCPPQFPDKAGEAAATPEALIKFPATTLPVSEEAGAVEALPPKVTFVFHVARAVWPHTDGMEAQRRTIILSNFTRFILKIFWLVKFGLLD